MGRSSAAPPGGADSPSAAPAGGAAAEGHESGAQGGPPAAGAAAPTAAAEPDGTAGAVSTRSAWTALGRQSFHREVAQGEGLTAERLMELGMPAGLAQRVWAPAADGEWAHPGPPSSGWAWWQGGWWRDGWGRAHTHDCWAPGAWRPGREHREDADSVRTTRHRRGGTEASFRDIKKAVTASLRYDFECKFASLDRLAQQIRRLACSPERLYEFFCIECPREGEHRFVVKEEGDRVLVKALPSRRSSHGL